MAQASRGRLRPAIAALERLVGKRGAPAEAYHFLGLLMAEDGRAGQGVFHLERANAMSPGRAQFESNLGNVLIGLGRLDDAVDHYFAAIAADEAYAPARVGLAGALLSRGELARAEREARCATELAPDNPDAAANLASCLITTGRAADAVDHLKAAIKSLGPSIQLNTLLAAAMNYDDRTSPEEHLETHRMLGRLHAVGARAIADNTSSLPPLKPIDPGEKTLRVGYLSADFRDHPVGMFIEPALAASHQTEPAIEVFCYDLCTNPDAFSERLRGHPVIWRDAATLSDAALVAMIRNDGIDILVELSGHSLGHRQTALAVRAAPIQVSMLGYPATTGNPAIDVRLVDRRSDPKGSEAWCTEHLLRLDPCAWCFSAPDNAPLGGDDSTLHRPLRAASEPDDGPAPVRFGSFNNLAKTTPAVLDTWAAILDRVPGSTLTLKNGAFVDAETRERLAKELTSRGIPPDRLVMLEPTRDAAAHLDAYGQLDIALDTFPYAGTTTTCEALWMGVPVVTLAGELHAGRVGVSLLGAVGMEDLVAQSTDSYVRIASNLAHDRSRLVVMKAGLRDRMRTSPLMDAVAFRARLHAAYTSLLRNGSNPRTGASA